MDRIPRRSGVPAKVRELINSSLENPEIRSTETVKQENKFCSFDIPANWVEVVSKKDEKGYKARFSPKSTKGVMLDIFIEKRNEPKMTELVEHFNFLLAWNEDKFKGDEKIIFDGCEAYKCNYATINTGEIQIICVVENVVYMINYEAIPDLYEDFLEDFNNIVGSFKTKRF